MKYKKWTEKELEKLRKLVDIKDDTEIAAQFGVTKDSLHSILKRHKIHRSRLKNTKLLRFKYKRRTGKHYTHLEKPCKICTSHMKSEKGYVWVVRNGRTRALHRVVWEEANGPVPDGMVIRHKCDQPDCCELTHLEIGTPKQNIQDQIDRGRFAWGERAATSKLTAAQVKRIRNRLDKKYSIELVRKLAERYGITEDYTISLYKRETWKHLEKKSIEVEKQESESA